MAICERCGKGLTNDEIGLYKKMVCRSAVSFQCLPCMAEHFHCDTALLEKKIQQFKKMGCMLFTPEER